MMRALLLRQVIRMERGSLVSGDDHLALGRVQRSSFSCQLGSRRIDDRLESGGDDEASETYNTIDYALDLDDTHCCGQDRPRIEIWENGNRFQDAGTYQVGDVFEVLVNDQGVVEYWMETVDSVVRDTTTVEDHDTGACTVANQALDSCMRRGLVHTSTVVPSFPLHVDASFNMLGASVVELELIPATVGEFDGLGGRRSWGPPVLSWRCCKHLLLLARR